MPLHCSPLQKNHTSGLGTHSLETVSPKEDAPGTLTLSNLTYGSTVRGSRVKTIALVPKILSIFLHISIFSYMIHHLCLYSTPMQMMLLTHSLAFRQLWFINSASRHLTVWAEVHARPQTPSFL